MLMLHDGRQRVMLEKRPPTGIWGGLWSLPEAENLAELEQKTGLALTGGKMLPSRLHRLTHLRLHIQPVLLRTIQAEQVKCSDGQRWITLDGQSDHGVPQPVAQLLQALRHGELG